MKRMQLMIAVLTIALSACAVGGAGTDTRTDTSAGAGTDTLPRETEEYKTEKQISYDPVHLTADKFGDILIHGRTQTNGSGLHIDWQWSGFTMEGELRGEISVELEMKEPKQCFVSVEVDGEQNVLEIPSGSEKFVIADVKEGHHRITFRKCTEYRSSRLEIRALDFNGELVKPEIAEKGPKIEFIGDSVTCGVGSSPTVAKSFSDPRDCSVLNAYSVMTAKALDADANIVSIGGWGVSKGSNAKNGKIPDVYRYTSYKTGAKDWDFKSWQPDFVVIMLGANDEGADPAVLGKAVSDFLKEVRADNPKAKIIWVYGYLFTDFSGVIREAISEMNDGNVFYLEVSPDMKGGWNHPSYKAQCGFAEAITEKIRSLSE